VTLRGFSDLLIPDDFNRRALDETIADWREERAKAESAFGRAFTDFHGLAGITRVCAMTAGAGLARADVWRFLLFTSFAAAAVAAMQLRLYGSGLTVLEALPLFLGAILGPFGMMASAFGFGLKPHRRFPGITLAATAVLLVGLGLGVVVPASNQYFRESVAERLAGAGKRAPLARGIPETSAADLLRRAMTKDAGAPSARQALMQRLALTVAAPVLLLLGAGLRARIHTWRGWRVSQIGGGIAASVIFVSSGAAGAGLAALALAAWPSLSRSDLRTLPWCTATVVSLLVTLWVSRLRPSGFGGQARERRSGFGAASPETREPEV
jgi:hypothetical protein